MCFDLGLARPLGIVSVHLLFDFVAGILSIKRGGNMVAHFPLLLRKMYITLCMYPSSCSYRFVNLLCTHFLFLVFMF